MRTGFTKKIKSRKLFSENWKEKKKKKKRQLLPLPFQAKGEGGEDMANLFVYMFGKLKTCKEHSREFLKVSEHSFRALFDLYCWRE